MTEQYRVGWDIGGAHLKAALLNESGQVVDLVLQACPLWQGIAQLHRAVEQVMAQLPKSCAYGVHALTMTGELADCFASRREGVAQILAAMQALLPKARVYCYVGAMGLLPVARLDASYYEAIASANWLASASLVAQHFVEGLFVDIGSTTSDILVLQQQGVVAQGLSDYQRLCSGELVYTGIIRTPVMAITQRVPAFAHTLDGKEDGAWVGLMAEHFATMADVYRLTGQLNEAHDKTVSADGAEKNLLGSARRLSRMIGCDFEAAQLPRWQRFAHYLRAAQLELLQNACALQLQRANLSATAPLIGAGVGQFLVKDLAKSLQRPYVDFTTLLPQALTATPLSCADCAPAVAVGVFVTHLAQA